ncbi:E3 ubiquitin-protein ligase TRIM7-like isoform X2 [Neopsephotus bourkii]|uniref:E3 ubiquitin-protein ligase TRIM7-like isoform X2 n=1 Tax=Neopsephotus bourkii TaxID=309878 RepID=UPI002AA576A3|nr:E3 ubiquitin-protein ligase TRIM7-like isoform X2 [Neopsephotus bourkii]
MARAVLALGESLVEEATCPLCLGLFQEPLITDCGHSYCGPCLAALMGVPPRPVACPQCRAAVAPASLRPNRSLRSMAQLTEALDKARRAQCQRHGELLGLFCETCRCLLCPLCRGEPQHRDHPARFAEEAARQLRETLQNNLVLLQKEKEEFRPMGQKKSESLLEKVASEQQSLRGAFMQLQEFLQEQEDVLLAQLHEVHEELNQERCRYISSISERETLLDTLIAEIESKCDQPVAEFLTNVGKILDRCEAVKTPIPEPVSPGLERTLERLFQSTQMLVAVMAEFKVKVWLDPETASPYLNLSEDCKTVWLASGEQELHDNPKRFTGSPSVLGSKGFMAGRHYWELEVGHGDSWAVGVALESVQRKDVLSRALGKIWALRLDWNRQYTALHMPPTPLELNQELRKIRIHLDYEGGQVTFYNAENMMQILQFKATFTEKVFPYFWLSSQETYIQLCA